MGRHSRKGSAPQGAERPRPAGDADSAIGAGGVFAPLGDEAARTGSGRRRKAAAPRGPEPHHPEQHHSAGAEPQQVRGGHPEGPGADRGPAPAGRSAAPAFRPRPAGPANTARVRPGPRSDFLEAFDPPPGPGNGKPARPADAAERRPGAPAGPAAPAGPDGPGGPDGPLDAEQTGPGGSGPGGGLARTLTGIAAAAVTTVLAVVVAGQVTGAGPDGPVSRAAGVSAAPGLDDSGTAGKNGADEAAGKGPDARAERPDRSEGRVTPPTYAQSMSRQLPMDPKLAGPDAFDAVPGADKAPGKGRKWRYRIDVEKGLGLDAGMFARAVRETLNDRRSWAHGGAMTFERISSGEPDFVITLASPGTTALWCAKSGLDTTVDNVSCDSAATERVMINAYRWARGSQTYGPKAMLAYRQMLINHEVGHRLGHNHVNCATEGSLAPVMQQQTKSLDIEGVTCRANPWAFPKG
ncbi:DUF3152 domain-containing protein [Streptomyces sp. ODS05-4]|uniref:DUF3152 domain-containing protein n=1 Tax=Streptomyces sp. ODS05-4 TaxID=2944939 RepID=UPI0021088721|nr:DUF3152 domain-containing protein [Streptomyces sp. ODS05-4]